MKLSSLILAVVATVLTPLRANAQSESFSLETKPRWEAGLGVGYLNGFDYPGSKDPNVAQIALPFFIYRSSVFRVGDGGIGAVAIEEPRLKLDVSLGGSLSAGPRLQYKLLDKQWTNGSSSELTWDSKIRVVIATDFKGVRTQGFVFASGFALRQRAIAGEKIDLVLNTDITFADQRYNDYLYSVPTDQVSAQRQRFNAKAGYVESRLFLGLAIRPVKRLRIFTGFAAFSYANSANENSPLFETTTGTQYAIGLVWSALQSKRTIDVYRSS